VRRLFEETNGLHPIFAGRLDANSQTAPMDTVEQRRNNFSMLLQGKFIRRIAVAPTAEFTLASAFDPLGESTSTLMQFFRRPLPSSNFKAHLVMWDAANTVGTDLQAGLEKQARGIIPGALQGPAPTPEVVSEIVAFEKALSVAQIFVPGAGLLNAAGARGGPQHHATQPLIVGRFDLFDAWRGSRNPYRAQIARGQELFNSANVGNGRSCNGCHNAANDGQSVSGQLFDIGTSRPEHAKADMAIFTLQNKVTGETLRTTDGGRGIRSGLWADLNKFKTPSLRGAVARGHFFHNGIAGNLEEVVRYYEANLGFRFSRNQREDLVAFLNAL
jgi:cytochrome c peroxidase